VAIVGGVNQKTGMFERVGGNQGGINWRRMTGYDFRRGAGPSGGAGTAQDRQDWDTVRGTVFGSTHAFPEPSEPVGRPTASGVSNAVPGIALPNRGTLGQMFEVRTPDGRVFTLPQTDIGPAKRTGRGIDITSSAAAQMGYTSKNFPTDSQFS